MRRKWQVGRESSLLPALLAGLIVLLGWGADLPQFPPPPSRPSGWQPPYPSAPAEPYTRNDNCHYDAADVFWDSWWYPKPLFGPEPSPKAAKSASVRVPGTPQARLELLPRPPALMRMTNATLLAFLSSEAALLTRATRRLNESLRTLPNEGAGQRGSLLVHARCGPEGGLAEIRYVEDQLGVLHRSILEQVLEDEKWPPCSLTLLNVLGTNLVHIQIKYVVE